MSLRTPRPRKITFFRVVRVFRGRFSKEPTHTTTEGNHLLSCRSRVSWAIFEGDDLYVYERMVRQLEQRRLPVVLVAEQACQA